MAINKKDFFHAIAFSLLFFLLFILPVGIEINEFYSLIIWAANNNEVFINSSACLLLPREPITLLIWYSIAYLVSDTWEQTYWEI